MTECNQSDIKFPPLKRRKVQANFQGGEFTTNGGALLLRQADRDTGLTESIAAVLADKRRHLSCEHSLLTIRRVGLAGTKLARAQAGSIRLKRLKAGAVILRNTRRILFLLSMAYPHRTLFCQVADRLDTG